MSVLGLRYINIDANEKEDNPPETGRTARNGKDTGLSYITVDQ